MKSKYLLLCLLLIILFFIPFEEIFGQKPQIIEKNNAVYLANTIIVKLKSKPSILEKTVSLNASLSKSLEQFGLISAEKLLPFNTRYESTLNNVIIVNYRDNVDPFLVAYKLKENDEVEWAEPKILRELDYIPNDPYLNSQYALEKIKAYEAWDISKGDSSIIVGIIDSGVNWGHPDLAPHIWINKNEIPDNNIDDDNNGFIDDIRGWDFGGLEGTPDNDPSEDLAANHGTYVAGISGAVTDNDIGVASIGFNCKVMPVKVTARYLASLAGTPYIFWGSEGIIYAADNGAKIINCSFGGDIFSKLEQEAINYATSRGALVVASAGNDNNDYIHYPSGCENVLSVASTDQEDLKSSFSNYGISVDVCAPGSDIYSTFFTNNYASNSGTSMSAPFVSGLAVLVMEKFPDYLPQQVAEQIRVNADDIYTQNPDYMYMLGKGRINASNTLTSTNSISVRAADIKFFDEAPGGNGNGYLENGETISIKMKFINYLAPVSNLNITLESMSPGAIVQNNNFNAGSLATLDSTDNYTLNYSVLLDNSLQQNEELIFRLIFSADNYSDFQLFNTTVNVSYDNQSANDISLTISSDGALGFNDFGSFRQGYGFHYLNGLNKLNEGGLILASSSTKVADAIRDSTGNGRSRDFVVIEPFKLITPGAIADQEGLAIFNDDSAGSGKMGLNVMLKSYSYTDVPDRNYIILQYRITNTSGENINSLYAGLLLNFNVSFNGLQDVAAYDKAGNFAYKYDSIPVPGLTDIYIGTALLSSNNYKYSHFYNFNVLNTGFNNPAKWFYLTQPAIGSKLFGLHQFDISQIISGGPFTIGQNEFIDISFALGASHNLDGLVSTFINARSKYNEIITSSDLEENKPSSFYLAQNYPNPFNPNTIISWEMPVSGHVLLKIYDILGKEVTTLVDDFFSPGYYKKTFDGSKLASGMYIYKLAADSYVLIKKMMLIK